jgi:error-prone DNA polymerase
LQGLCETLDLEYIGLPKLDLLGFKMHMALHQAGRLTSKRLGKRIDPYDPPLTTRRPTD